MRAFLQSTGQPWFVRAFQRLRLPYWLGMMILVFVPVTALFLIDTFFAPYDLDLMIVSILIYAVPLFYFLWGVNYSSRKLGKLSNYAESRTDDRPSKRSKPITVLVLTLIVWTTLIGFYSFFEGVPAFFAEHLMPQAYIFLILSYFISVYITSMLEIYRLGKLPLRLKLYTEDKTLGLKPFGLASLQLTAVLLSFALGISLVTIAFGNLTTSDIILNLGITGIGAVMFFLPLLSIRRKLQEAKRAELRWLLPKHTRIIEQLKGQDSTTSDQQIATQLLMIHSIQADIGRIQNWPIDTSILTRLFTLLVLPPVLGVVARELIRIVLNV